MKQKPTAAIVASDRSYARMPDGSLRRLSDYQHKALELRIRRGKPRAIFEGSEISRWPSKEIQPGTWGLKKPKRGIRLRDRLAAAWECLRGRTCAVRWYS